MVDDRLDRFLGDEQDESAEIEATIEEAYASVFGSQQGQIVLADILNLCDWPTPTKASQPADVMARQGVAVGILGRLNVITQNKMALVRGLIRIGQGR